MDKNERKDITNSIRNILMNEFGLSRDYIRIEANKIISEEITKIANSFADTKRWDELFIQIINRKFQQEGIYSKNFERYIQEAAKEVALEFVKENITIKRK